VPGGRDIYDEAALQGRLWTPAVWRGTLKLAIWYDAHQSPITFSTGVSSWNDLSGNANHAIQATGANQPALSSVGWPTGRQTSRAIKPDGVSDRLDLTNPLTYSGTAGMSINCAIERTIITPNVPMVIASGGTGSCQFRFNLQAAYTTQVLRANLLQVHVSSAAPVAGRGVFGMDAATNFTAIWMDGNRETQTANDPAFTATLDSLFSWTAGSGDYNDGNAAEFIFSQQKLLYNEGLLVTGYLAWKWGTVNRLAASSPFKNRPPLIGD
jgi:hypothetical protein